MEIQDLKRWHWIVIGLIVGLALSYAFSNHDPGQNSAWRDYEIKQRDFDRDAFSRSRASGEPVLQQIVIEPPIEDFQHHALQIVKGKRLEYSTKYKQEFWTPFFYYASVPYVPIVHPLNVVFPTGKTVTEFLAVAQQTMAQPADAKTKEPWQGATTTHFRFGWEYSSRWSMLIWVAGGVLVIGGIWPTILNALVNVGLGGTKKERVHTGESWLSQFRSRRPSSTPAPVATVDTVDEAKRLDDLNAVLEARLASSGLHHTEAQPVEPIEEPAFAGAAAAPAPGAAIASATTEAAEPAAVAPPAHEPTPTEEELRDKFAAGDFYPVARGRSGGSE